MDSFFSSLVNQLTNATNTIPINILDTATTIVIYAEMAGVRRETIRVEPIRDILKISGTKINRFSTSSYNEIKHGHLVREIRLPLHVTKEDTVKIDSYEDGLLKIVIDKPQETPVAIVLKL